MNASVPMARKPSPFLMAALLISFLISLTLIIAGMDYMQTGLDEYTRAFLTVTGLTTLALSTYMLFQTRKRVFKLGLQMQPLTTTLLCQKCGFKNLREFTRSDYVFKQVEGQCPKCNEKTLMISSIYREVKEKAREES